MAASSLAELNSREAEPPATAHCNPTLQMTTFDRAAKNELNDLDPLINSLDLDEQIHVMVITKYSQEDLHAADTEQQAALKSLQGSAHKGSPVKHKLGFERGDQVSQLPKKATPGPKSRGAKPVARKSLKKTNVEVLQAP
jgi:hypothetical protein